MPLHWKLHFALCVHPHTHLAIICFTTRVICICMDSSVCFISRCSFCFVFFRCYCRCLFVSIFPLSPTFSRLFFFVYFSSTMRDPVMWRTKHCHLAIAYSVSCKHDNTLALSLTIQHHYCVVHTQTIVSCNANAQTNKIKLFLNFFLCRLQACSVCFQQARIYVLKRKKGSSTHT